MAKHIQFDDYGEIKRFEIGAWPLSGNFAVNIFFVDGLLIDTGFPNLRKTIKRTLKHLHVDQMLVTHFHEDHSGNTELLQSTFHCPVFASARTAEIMAAPPRISPAQHLTWGRYKSYFNYSIVGNKLKTRNFCFDIIPIPGHAPDMIALHEPNQGWLFSADLYVHHRIRFFMTGERFNDQIESLERVMALDFDKMYCSHNPELADDPKSLLKRKRDYFIDFRDRVIHFHKKGMTTQDIMAELKLKDGPIKLLSLGRMSVNNMIEAVIRDMGI